MVSWLAARSGESDGPVVRDSHRRFPYSQEKLEGIPGELQLSAYKQPAINR